MIETMYEELGRMAVKFNLKVRICMEEPLVAQWFISIQSAAAEFDGPSRDREVHGFVMCLVQPQD
jgi:hypothetical protein